MLCVVDSDIDECEEGRGQCDEETSRCKNTDGSYVCSCLPGMERENDTSCRGRRETK